MWHPTRSLKEHQIHNRVSGTWAQSSVPRVVWKIFSILLEGGFNGKTYSVDLIAPIVGLFMKSMFSL